MIEEAVRRYLGPSVLDRLWDQNRLDEDVAMEIAREEIAAHRRAVLVLAANLRQVQTSLARIIPALEALPDTNGHDGRS
ncbi:MAG: hypothetical protein ACRD0Q_04615 [Acidimicrobiales bacterium]